MTGGQLANGLASMLVLISSSLLILIWTKVGSWWTTSVGRFMILKAAAIGFTGFLTVALTLARFASDWDFLRYIQAVLWILVSLAFLHHTRLVWKLNRGKEEK